ncbi:PTS sugar transporter subunit IIA [Bacillus licheniformis]|nr:PTS sugar transporter subunit IIA [Bacillus licheniformis]
MREKMSATNIGAGIAIPHANAKLIKQSAIAIATLKEPLDWGSEKYRSSLCWLSNMRIKT